MPISVEVNSEKRMLVATATGDLEFADFRDFIRTVRAGDRRDWTLLFDASQVTSHMTAAQVGSLADQVASVAHQEGSRARVALISNQHELFGLMRMYQMLSELQGVTDTIGVFRVRAEAEAWLA